MRMGGTAPGAPRAAAQGGALGNAGGPMAGAGALPSRVGVRSMPAGGGGGSSTPPNLPPSTHKPPPPPPPPDGGGAMSRGDPSMQRGEHGGYWKSGGVDSNYSSAPSPRMGRRMMSGPPSGQSDLRGDHHRPPPPPDGPGPLSNQLRRGSADSYGASSGPMRSHSPASPHLTPHHRERDRQDWMEPKWDYPMGRNPPRPPPHHLAKQAYSGGYHNQNRDPDRQPLHNDRLGHSDRMQHRMSHGHPGPHNDQGFGNRRSSGRR